MNILEAFVNDFKRWASKPYDEDGDVISWFLFIGFLLASTYLWTRVINRILD